MTATRDREADGASWTALGVRVHLLVTDPATLPAAQAMLEQELVAVDAACSRFRPDGELARLDAARGAPCVVSPLLHEAVAVALTAARLTDGDVDPTLGAELGALGYDRDLAELPPDGPAPVLLARTASWRDVTLGPGTVRLPRGVRLDLGATAKAWAADRAAARLAASLGTGVLVNLGGDLAVAGPVPDGGWPVQVQDHPGDPDGPTQVVSVAVGGLATSSTTARRWARGGSVLHHLLDPRTGRPVASPWRTVTVAARDCLTANTLSTAAVVRGAAAPGWLDAGGVPARLVGVDGMLVHVGGWPVP